MMNKGMLTSVAQGLAAIEVITYSKFKPCRKSMQTCINIVCVCGCVFVECFALYIDNL